MASHEFQITIFSPEGKLHQIDYAFKAIKQCNLTSVGIRGKNCVAVCIEKKVDDRMIDPNTVTNIFRVTPEVGVMMTGREADGRAWITKLKKEAYDFLNDNGFQIPADVLAQRAADIAQLYTQKSFMRAYAVEMIFFSVDQEKGPLLLKVDPAGHYMGYYAVSSGVKDNEASNALEKLFKEKEGFKEMDKEQTIRASITCLQDAIGQDFKKNDIEVAYVDQDTKQFIKLNEDEIEQYLLAVQKFD